MKYIVAVVVICGILGFILKMRSNNKKKYQIKRLNCFLMGVSDMYTMYKNMEHQLELEEFNFTTVEGTSIKGILTLCGEEITITVSKPEQLRKVLSTLCVHYLDEANYILGVSTEIEQVIKQVKCKSVNIESIINEGVEHINEVKMGVRTYMLRYGEKY